MTSVDRMLSLRDLRVWYPVRVGLIGGLVRGEAKHVRAVDGITFEVSRGEIFCLVGESGCGKTTTGKAILRLTDPTGGNILYNISQEDWDRLAAIEGRLKELGTPDAAAAREAEPQLRDLLRAKRQITQMLYPWSRVGAYLEREHLERNVAFLKERYASVYKGTDPSLERQLARGRERFEILREYGAWFTVRRAKKLRLLERSLKEAEYRLRIAEATHGRTRRFERQRRRVKRQLDRMARHIRKDSPEAQQQIAALEAKLETKKTLLRRLDLIDLKKEYDREKPRLEATRRASLEIPEAASQRIRELESEMETIREKGDRVLEALELETLRDELIARYDLAAWGKRHTAELRKRMQIIYQDPYESLNPKLSIFDIVAEPIMANKIVSTMSEAEAVVRKSLEDVGLKPAEEYMFRYPHELSGGQRQRVGIATALVVDPDFIVADEPVSMLDASVRTEILALLLDLRKRRNLTYLFITHDLGLAWIIADRIAVMYLGNIVEMGDGPEIIRNPRHPYTRALISVVPSPNPDVQRDKIILRGERPNPVEIPTGCRFHPRCPMAVGICGWNADEVRDELLRVFQADEAEHPEAQGVSIVVEGSSNLRIQSSDPGKLETYLKAWMPALGPKKPALGAIREMRPEADALVLTLHVPTEPPLQQISDRVFVACHLVEPESPGVPVAEGAAVRA